MASVPLQSTSNQRLFSTRETVIVAYRQAIGQRCAFGRDAVIYRSG